MKSRTHKRYATATDTVDEDPFTTATLPRHAERAHIVDGSVRLWHKRRGIIVLSICAVFLLWWLAPSRDDGSLKTTTMPDEFISAGSDSDNAATELGVLSDKYTTFVQEEEVSDGSECTAAWSPSRRIADAVDYNVTRHSRAMAPFDAYEMISFAIGDRQCIVVLPQCALSARPWLWRGIYWGYRAFAELRLLELGFHAVYCDTQQWLANERSMTLMNGAYEVLVDAESDAPLAERGALIGFSRGTIALFAFALQYPERVNALVFDAPIYDLSSVPIPLDEHRVLSGAEQRCDANAAERTAMDSSGTRLMPVDDDDCSLCKYLHKVHRIAYGITSEDEEQNGAVYAEMSVNAARRCLRHLAGDASLLVIVGHMDDSVSARRNALQLKYDYEEAGGSATLFVKNGNHRPAMLLDSEPIVNFVLLSSAAILNDSELQLARRSALLAVHQARYTLEHAIDRPAPYIMSLALDYTCARLVPTASAGLDPDVPGSLINASEPSRDVRVDTVDALWCTPLLSTDDATLDFDGTLNVTRPSVRLFWALPRRLLSGDALVGLDSLYAASLFAEYRSGGVGYNDLDLSLHELRESKAHTQLRGRLKVANETTVSHVRARRLARHWLHRSFVVLRRRFDVESQLRTRVINGAPAEEELVKMEYGPDEFTGAVEGDELIDFRFAHLGRCVYASRLDLSVNGVYNVHLVHLRDRYLGLQEIDRRIQPLSWLHVLARDTVRVRVTDAPHQSATELLDWRERWLPVCSTVHDLTFGRYVAPNGASETRFDKGMQPQLRNKYRASPRVWHHDASQYVFYPWSCRRALTTPDEMLLVLNGRRVEFRGDSHMRQLYAHAVNNVCGTTLGVWKEWQLKLAPSDSPRCTDRRTALDFNTDYFGWATTDLRNYTYSVTNFGQHLCDYHMYTYADYRATVDHYARLITNATVYAERPARSHVIWVTTMPSMFVSVGADTTGRDWRMNPRIGVWNRYATLVMRRHNVQVLDVANLMWPLKEWSHDSAHFIDLFAQREQHVAVINALWLLMQSERDVLDVSEFQK